MLESKGYIHIRTNIEDQSALKDKIDEFAVGDIVQAEDGSQSIILLSGDAKVLATINGGA